MIRLIDFTYELIEAIYFVNTYSEPIKKGGNMTLIRTMAPEKADGDIKNGYDLFINKGIHVPKPFRLLSASPGLFNLMVQRNRYYANHPKLSFTLLAHIRYFVSSKLNYDACRIHNKNMLLKQGLDEKDFDRMHMDPGKSLLEENERKMLSFVLKAMDAPETVSEKDMDILHDAGWEDADILDALAQGVGMIDHHIFMQVFKPDF